VGGWQHSSIGRLTERKKRKSGKGRKGKQGKRNPQIRSQSIHQKRGNKREKEVLQERGKQVQKKNRIRKRASELVKTLMSLRGIEKKRRKTSLRGGRRQIRAHVLPIIEQYVNWELVIKSFWKDTRHKKRGETKCLFKETGEETAKLRKDDVLEG